jgi:transposase
MTDLAALARRVEELEKQRTEERAALIDERDRYKALYQEMLQRCAKLERGIVTQKKSERLPTDVVLSEAMLELLLPDRPATEPSEAPAESVEIVREHERHKPTGRKPLPDHLPQVEVELIPDVVQQEGLDAFERIGEERSEHIDRIPACSFCVVVRRPKFVRKNRDRAAATTVYIAEPHDLPISRGLAGPGMLADTLVRRWQDHMPLNRLEDMYRREDLHIARSTICGWHEQLVESVEPMIAAMREDCFAQPYLCTDATGVLVQAKEQCRRGHFWVIVAPDKHVLFEYTRDHTNAAVDSILADYEGYLVADAHAVYDHLYADGRTIEVNCWAHARRYFFKAMSSDPQRAETALKLIGALFRHERAFADKPRKQREALRRKHSTPIVERFFAWCDEQWPVLLESTPIYDGVRYARNQREGLQRFLSDGRLPLDNNISERELRRQAVGRKNWLFVGSDDGARANAVFTSLLASCRMHDIEPWAYLRDLLCLLPRYPKHRALELAPAYWKLTQQREDIRLRLDRDPFRTAELALAVDD